MLRWILLILLIVVGVWFYFFLNAAGVFLTLTEKSPGPCDAVTGVVGAEDLTIDRETNTAYLAAYDRRAAFAGNPTPGAIWAYDVSAAGAQPVNLTPTADKAFLPQGLSLFRGPDGRKTLFVINLGGTSPSIEIFDVAPGTLTHRRTVTGLGLVTPNDIVGVGPDSFYVTNDHAYTAGWQRAVEEYLRLRLTTVYHFDGAKFTPAVENLGYSNGINVSPDGRSAYVSASAELAVHVYDRDPQTNVLTERANVAVPGYADNIELLPDGSLLLGVHSKPLELVAHASDPAQRSTSHIMHLTPDGKGGFTPETLYLNFGQELSGASVGASANKRLLIGSIFEPKILNCSWEQGP